MVEATSETTLAAKRREAGQGKGYGSSSGKYAGMAIAKVHPPALIAMCQPSYLYWVVCQCGSVLSSRGEIAGDICELEAGGCSTKLLQMG